MQTCLTVANSKGEKKRETAKTGEDAQMNKIQALLRSLFLSLAPSHSVCLKGRLRERERD